MAETYTAGYVTAYGAAVRGGYTGTYEEFCAEQAKFAENAAAVAQAKEDVETMQGQVEQTAATFVDTTVPAAVATVQAEGATQVQAVQSEGTMQAAAVETVGAQQKAAVEAAGSDAVDAVDTAETAATDAVTAAQTAAVQAVQTESTTQQAAVQAKGAETIASIPEDYTALSNEVDDLKSAFEENLLEVDKGSVVWQNGGISTNGGLVTSTNRCRNYSTINYENDRIIKVRIAEGYKVAVREYNSPSTIAANFVGTPIPFTQNGFELFTVEGHYYRLLLGATDDRDITADTLPDDVVHVYALFGTDADLQTPGIPADAYAVGKALSEKLTFAYHDDTDAGSMQGSSGAIYNSTDKKRYRSRKFCKVTPGSIIELNLADADSISTLNVFWFKADTTVLSHASLDVASTVTLTVPDSAEYFMLLIEFEEIKASYSGFEIKSNNPIVPCHYPNIRNTNNTTLAFNFCVSGDAMSSGRLILPPNYNVQGQAVPLIAFVHGSNAMTTWTANMTPSYIDYFNYLANEGFAVFDCYPWTNKETLPATYSPFAIPANKNSYLRGIEYVCSRFNVDRGRVVLLCKSQGGMLGHWAYTQTEFPLKGVGLFAPSTDILLADTGELLFNQAARSALSKYVDFAGTDEEKTAFIQSGLMSDPLVVSFIGKNTGKFASMIPAAQGIVGSNSEDIITGGTTKLSSVPQWMQDAGLPAFVSGSDPIPAIAARDDYIKNAKCPVKFWCAFDDAATSSYANYAVYTWLLNGGSDAVFRELPIGTGGHHAMDTGTNALKSSGTTRLGIAYADVPTAYVEAADFFANCLSM